MAVYLVQAGYTSQAWTALTKAPEDRSVGLAKLCEAAGGRLLTLYYCFGEFDLAVLMEAPDDVAAAACVMAAVTAGHISRIQTTKLLTVAEAMEAMRKAGGMMYRGPQ